MKKLILLLAAGFLLCLASCADGTENTTAPKDENADGSGVTGNVLVAYFSCTGATESVAEKIRTETDGTLSEIVPKVPYTQADLNYGNSNSRTSEENRNDSARPEISGGVDNLEQYDTIFLGYPIWFGKAPKIIYTFLESHDFSGKTIVPFCTSSSSSMGSSDTNLHPLAEGATWKGGRRFSRDATQADVANWVKGIVS